MSYLPRSATIAKFLTSGFDVSEGNSPPNPVRLGYSDSQSTRNNACKMAGGWAARVSCNGDFSGGVQRDEGSRPCAKLDNIALT